MIVQPRIRGFICITAHPTGCAAHVASEIATVQSKGAFAGAKNVLVVGSSTGYGLSSRIAAAFGAGAATTGVFFERPSDKGRPASAGWYNAVAFEAEARKAGLFSRSLNGDAFADEVKAQTLEAVRQMPGKIDLVIYSLAAPRRTDPKTGENYRATLKPIGQGFTSKSLDTDKHRVEAVSLEAASEADIAGTVKVMGGEDWALWMDALAGADLLAEGARSIAYSYIGPELTYPIYWDGTIGQAKKHLDQTRAAIDGKLAPLGGKAYVSVNKAVVTQASSAIPVVPLYLSILKKVLQERGQEEGCIEQIDRLFRDRLTLEQPPLDDAGRLRVDDYEMQPEVQEAIQAIWPTVETENLQTLTDYAGYQEDFLKLFGFNWEGVDYGADVEVDLRLPEA
ncbi:MAG: enoyl-ACP reductase FabV [Opitutales bacterium]